MKAKVLFLVSVLLFSVSSCTVRWGDGGKVIEPSEKIVKKKYRFDAFEKVVSQIVGTILLIQSSDGRSEVALSAPENYISYFEFKNNDGELVLKYSTNNIALKMDSVRLIVYSPKFTEISNKGAAEIMLDRLKINELEIKNSGVGTFDLKNLDVHELEVSCTGVGNIKLSGTAEQAEYKCSGVGKIDAQDVKAKRVEASVSGVGGIDCYASESLEGNVTGVGGLKYAGHPQNKNLKHSVVGSITEL